jgi:hypothetical protein
VAEEVGVANTVEKWRNKTVPAPTTAGELYQYNGTQFALLTPTADDNLKVPAYVHGSTALVYRTPPWKTVSKTANYTATAHDLVILCDSTGGSFTITLPAVTGTDGRVYVVKKTSADANTVTIDGDGAETIDGAATYVIAVAMEAITLVSNGTAWYIV